jgi:hypothetical protein
MSASEGPFSRHAAHHDCDEGAPSASPRQGATRRERDAASGLLVIAVTHNALAARLVFPRVLPHEVR